MSGVGGALADRDHTETFADQVVTPSGYRPHLDGLRAVAVYLVVLFHAGLQRVGGGYIGVDVFFVLSGFLVTQLLVRDLAGGHRVRFSRFYARRFRRLLPAVFVALIGTALIVTLVDPIAALASVNSFKAAFLYSANWWFIHESTGYFGADVASNPVLPYWSLAVEEQFYLVWPVALAALFWAAGRLRRRQLLVVRVVVASAALASVGWALHLRTADPIRAYYGTDARVYQLLAGASLALVPGLVDRLGVRRSVLRVVAPAAVVAIVVAGTSIGGDDPIVRGIVATVLTAVALVALEGEQGGWTTRVLSSPPLVYLGRVSYGTYLWHWPVVIVATEALGLTAPATAVLACVVATGLASLSYQLLEHPVRSSSFLDRYRLPVVAIGLTISIIGALVIIPAVIEPRSSGEVTAQVPTDRFTPVPDGIDFGPLYAEGFGQPLGPDGEELTCLDAPAEACTVVRGSGTHVLLMGDSNAEMMTNAFIAMAEANDLTLSLAVRAGCPWQRGLYVIGPRDLEGCRRAKEDAYARVIPELDPDVIIVMDAAYTEDKGPSDPEGKPIHPEVDATTDASVAELTAGGRPLVVIEPMPRHPDIAFEPFKCLRTSEVVEDCRYVAVSELNWYELKVREIAAENDLVLSADFDRLVCPYLPICDPIIGGVVVKWDDLHLTARFSTTLAAPIAAYLRSHDLLTS